MASSKFDFGEWTLLQTTEQRRELLLRGGASPASVRFVGKRHLRQERGVLENDHLIERAPQIIFD